MKVLFAVPSYLGVRDAKFFFALEKTMEYVKQHGHSVGVTILTGCCYVQLSRIRLVREFLYSEYDKLFFLDEDIEWQPEDALKLIEMDDDLIAGIYPYKREPLDFPVVIHCNPDNTPIVRADGCISASSLPTGFMCVKREVFILIRNMYPQYHFTDYKDGEIMDYFDFFPQGIQDGRWVGEDYAFCRLWEKIGGKMWIVPNITINHHDRLKDRDYAGNYHEFLLSQPQPQEAFCV